ncbi:MAG: hypothetical protein V4727_08880 [Verrucomicrobiota bacterium]
MKKITAAARKRMPHQSRSSDLAASGNFFSFSQQRSCELTFEA